MKGTSFFTKQILIEINITRSVRFLHLPIGWPAHRIRGKYENEHKFYTDYFPPCRKVWSASWRMNIFAIYHFMNQHFKPLGAHKIRFRPIGWNRAGFQDQIINDRIDPWCFQGFILTTHSFLWKKWIGNFRFNEYTPFSTQYWHNWKSHISKRFRVLMAINEWSKDILCFGGLCEFRNQKEQYSHSFFKHELSLQSPAIREV